ncbi:recombinase family protein [Harryflintia acetispora]|uniref:recombinase family protein n=1 Tax=Harryflintia acetispora TaxID=1849041 RepID=UPI00256FCEB1|nr:recombinase family protein [Harryflintia acetispora]
MRNTSTKGTAHSGWKKRIFNRKGENFTNTTLIKMIQNPAYTGILRNGESKSEIFPDLQIIRSELFRQAQVIRKNRAMKHNDVPFNSKGKALLPGKMGIRSNMYHILPKKL